MVLKAAKDFSRVSLNSKKRFHDLIAATAMGVHMDTLNSGGSEYVAAVERIKQIIGLRPRTPLYWYDPVFCKTAAGKQVYSDIELTHSFTNQVRSGAGA